MINIKIICIGNLKEKFWIEASKEYQKRLQRFCKLSIVELQEQNKFNNIESILENEGRDIISNLTDKNILLDIYGKTITSEELAKKIESLSQIYSHLTFVIGGSYGVSNEVKEKITDKISFGKITLPHNLARIVLLEQIYRAFMINNGGKYHK